MPKYDDSVLINRSIQRKIYGNRKQYENISIDDAWFRNYQILGGQSDRGEFTMRHKKFISLNWAFSGDPPPDPLYAEYKDLIENSELSYMDIAMIIFRKYLAEQNCIDVDAEARKYFYATDSVTALS